MQRREFVRSSLTVAVALPLGMRWTRAAALADIPARTLTGESISLSGTDIDNLAASLRGTVLVPGSDGYDAARKLWNGMFDRRPALIARCASPADVIASVDFARSHNLLTAVKCGGHSATGKSSCDGGLMIDLSSMRSVRVDPTARVARVEGGALLGDLDHETRPFGLVTTAGTVSHTGAGGLTLGGGFGRVGRRFGLTCDNVISADVVTADGRLLHAHERENPDLHWAIRGGGGNFGVVTSFEYRLHPMDPTILGGVTLWPIEQARDVLRYFAEFSLDAPDELNTDIFMLQPPGAGPMLSVEFCWSGEPARGEKVIAPLRGFGKPLRDTVRPMPYVDLQRGADRVNFYGIHHYAKAGFANAIDASMVDALVDAYRAAPDLLMVVLQQAGGAIGRVPTDATAFVNRDARYWMMVMANWPDEAEDEQHIAACRDGWRRVEPFTSGYYTNALASDDDSRMRTIYGRNYDRLVDIKTRFDPDNLFRLNANIPPRRTKPA